MLEKKSEGFNFSPDATESLNSPGQFLRMTCGVLLLGLVLGLPSGITSWFDGLPWTGVTETVILSAVIPFLLMHCFSPNFFSPNSYNDDNIEINTTMGEELIDLQQALESGAITQEEYDELRKKIMERYDAPTDSTDSN